MMVSFSDVEHARAFASRLVDVQSLNARVSNAIVERIEHVRRERARAPSASLLVLGPAGTGKTHLFERMRRKVGPGATFVHVRPEIGIEASLRHVLLTVIDALKQPVADREYTQLDVVVGSALALVDGDNPRFPTAFLDKGRAMTPEERQDLLDRALDRFEREDPGLDATWLELFLGLPFLKSAERRAALAWLSGREPSELELRRLGRSEPMASSTVKPALRALATVAAQAAPLVIVFDQLENLVEADGRTERIHAHARVFAELFDEVSRLVLVQMALDGEWTHRIGPELAPSERSRLEAQIVHVELPSGEQREELLHAWLERLSPELRPGVFPAPFSRDDWEQLRRQPGLTPRMLFVGARKALAGEDPFVRVESESDTREEIDDVLARHWQEASQEAQTELERAAAEKRGIHTTRLSAAIRMLLLNTPDTKVTIASSASARESLRFTRAGVETLVFVVQATHGRSVAAALAHAAHSAESQRTVVVREQALALPPTWKAANENLERVRRAPLATVLEASRAELARALALHDLFADAQSQDLAGADGRPIPEGVVRAWAQRVLEPQGFALALGTQSLDDAWETNTLPLLLEEPKRDSPSDAGPARATDNVTLNVLRRLRLASVERVVAEVQRQDRSATRARVLAELRADPNVRAIGRTLVHLPSEIA
jgi:hypothetical protein